jgi:hypothetical protein
MQTFFAKISKERKKVPKVHVHLQIKVSFVLVAESQEFGKNIKKTHFFHHEMM